LKFGQVAVVEQAILVATTARLQSVAQVEIMLSKQLLLSQDVHILFVQADHGPVRNHIHVQQAWDVDLLLPVKD
jgi:hypothetical protein